MKMDLRPLVLALCLSACAPAPVSQPSEKYSEPATPECEGATIAGSHLVRMKDGSVEVVRGTSLEELWRNHMQPRLEDIDYAEPDYFVRLNSPAALNTVDPKTSSDNWAMARVGADTLWREGHRGNTVAVAVIDSGMELNHRQLKNQVLLNRNEIADNGIDDDGNGFIDDVGGWDFVGNRPLRGDYGRHGTHVSGLIVAAHSDLTAGPAPHVQGMAPHAKVLPLAFIGPDESGSISNAITAIKYALSRNVQIINASWGGSHCSRTLRDLIATMESRNVAFVAAAGNSYTNIDVIPDYPAGFNLPAQFTVGATDALDYRPDWSNFGLRNVHIFAPGTDIMSTVPTNSMEPLDGTSMATPIVSGALALLIGAEPQASLAQLRGALYASAYRGRPYANVSRGRLDLRNALAELRRRL